MTSTPTLGTTTTGAPMPLDVDRLIGSHACIVANAGGGKSGLIRRLLEVTHGQVQHIVLDLEDEFYTLRERFDYVIAGGDGGDAPATVDNAAGLALATLEHGWSLIVQLNDLGPVDAPRFVGAFLDALIMAPRSLWRPVLVVIDEAHRFAPQDGATAATHGVRALTAQGRKRGFTAVLASQRIAKIDADVRGDINNWLLGRVGQALDRRTMADALGFAPSSKEARGLQGLPDRTFWGFGPALSREPVLFRVADVETTPVRPGQAKVPTPPPAEALRAILAGLATVEVAAIPESGGKYADPMRDAAEVARLKAENARLVDELAASSQAMERLSAAAGEAQRCLVAARAVLDGHDIPALAPASATPIPAPSGGDPAPLPRREERAAPPKVPRPSGAAPSGAAGETATALPPRRRRILDAIAWCATLLGRTSVPRGIVAWVADISPKSSSYSNDLGAMRTGGLIDYPTGGELCLTTAGAGVAAWPDTPPTRDALRDAVCAQLPPRQVKIIDVLWENGASDRDALATWAGISPTSSSFSNDLGRLRTLGLVDYPAPGQVGLGSVFEVRD